MYQVKRIVSPFKGNEGVSSIPVSADKVNKVNARVENNTQQGDKNKDQVNEDDVIKRKRQRQKTSIVWNDFEEIEIAEGVMKADCKYCKERFATGGRGASTSHLKRHSCLEKKLHMAADKKQIVIPFHPSNHSNPFVSLGGRYSNEKMREIIVIAIMVHEHPFNIVEDEIWMWGFQYANPEFHKVTRKTVRSDCLVMYEEEKIIEDFADKCEQD